MTRLAAEGVRELTLLGQNPGIQLGFGFTLLAVGGLLGLNRSMLFQPLMDGIRTDSIESIMFPRDVVANANGSSATCARSSRRSRARS